MKEFLENFIAAFIALWLVIGYIAILFGIGMVIYNHFDTPYSGNTSSSLAMIIYLTVLITAHIALAHAISERKNHERNT